MSYPQYIPVTITTTATTFIPSFVTVNSPGPRRFGITMQPRRTFVGAKNIDFSGNRISITIRPASNALWETSTTYWTNHT